MMSGVELIANERYRQIYEEGWTDDHDDIEHDNNDLACAGACYAMPQHYRQEMKSASGLSPRLWPWAARYWKPTPEDRIRELVKAGALIAAEIDRLQRQKQVQP